MIVSLYLGSVLTSERTSSTEFISLVHWTIMDTRDGPWRLDTHFQGAWHIGVYVRVDTNEGAVKLRPIQPATDMCLDFWVPNTSKATLWLPCIPGFAAALAFGFGVL